MNDNKHYVDPSTSQRLMLEALGDPKFYIGDNLPNFYPTPWSGFMSYNGSISGRSPSAVKPRIHLEGLLYNLFHGAPHVPHARLMGKETRLAADAALSATSITITHSTMPAFWTGTADNILTADEQVLLMNRRPEPGESIWNTGVTNCDAEIITIDSGYSSGTSVTVSALAVARKAGAVIQAIFGTPASYAGPDYGFLYEKERPDAPTLGTASDGGSQTIQMTWTHSSQAADTITTLTTGESGPGVVSHYGIFVLKDGDTYCLYGPPKDVPERMQVAATVAITDSGLSGTTWTKTGINKYWKPSDNSLATIVAGDYYVGIACMNQSTFDPNLRMSPIAWTTSAVTIA